MLFSGPYPISVPPILSQLGDEGDESADVQNTWLPSSEMPSATNYFLQYISSRWGRMSATFSLSLLFTAPPFKQGGSGTVGVKRQGRLSCRQIKKSYFSPSSIENSTHSADASSNKFVFGQNMSERVLVSACPALEGFDGFRYILLCTKSVRLQFVHSWFIFL